MVRRSDFRLTLWRETYCLLTTGSIVRGDFSTLWRLCIEFPSQPKLASSLPNKRLSYWRLTGCARNDGERDLRFEGYGDNREGDIRRSDFRLTVWLVAYASLTVSSIVSGDSSVQFLLTSAKVGRRLAARR